MAVSRSPVHWFSKPVHADARLLARSGARGDAHLGAKVKHRSRVRQDPSQPNLRQVHLIHAELQEELAAARYRVAPDVIGENVTTRGSDLLGLPRGARPRLGSSAVVDATGLPNSCKQLDGYQDGLMAAVLHRDLQGNLNRARVRVQSRRPGTRQSTSGATAPSPASKAASSQ